MYLDGNRVGRKTRESTAIRFIVANYKEINNISVFFFTRENYEATAP
jgi:hypothetical protein